MQRWALVQLSKALLIKWLIYKNWKNTLRHFPVRDVDVIFTSSSHFSFEQDSKKYHDGYIGMCTNFEEKIYKKTSWL